MPHTETRRRQFKNHILNLLEQDDPAAAISAICRLPARKAVNPLFGFFNSREEIIRWRAITAMGAVVARLADENMESARVIMRRLLWSLNDESGGIGWGSPEAMGEIMARHEPLAREYTKLLVSFIREDGNYLEHEVLQRGVIWGLGRLAHARPELVRDAELHLHPYMNSSDNILRGFAAWAAGPIAGNATRPLLEQLVTDRTVVRIFRYNRLDDVEIGQVAQRALDHYTPR